jgi:hypothetical protein
MDEAKVLPEAFREWKESNGNCRKDDSSRTCRLGKSHGRQFGVSAAAPVAAVAVAAAPAEEVEEKSMFNIVLKMLVQTRSVSSR